MQDEALEAELAQLDPEQQRYVREQLELRARAGVLAAALGLAADDVAHMLRHLRRTPAERLSIGLRHGRLAGAVHRR